MLDNGPIPSQSPKIASADEPRPPQLPKLITDDDGDHRSTSTSTTAVVNTIKGMVANDDHSSETVTMSRNEGQRFAVLSYEQVKRLDAVMNQAVPIDGRGNFPTLDVKLKDLVRVVRSRLEADGIQVRDIRVNGGAASHILARDGTRHTSSYNDLDLIFGVDLSTNRNFERVKTAVLESLLDFLPEGANRKRISSASLKEAYVRKMVKVTSAANDSTAIGDRWSLITLGNGSNSSNGNNINSGSDGGRRPPSSRNVELKFVDTMRRQFEFSVDSFQIVLDSLLVFYECATMPMADDFYPTVVGESMYGDFGESLEHLHRKLIATRNPEEIRGGGLLKYCHLLVRGYRAVCPERIKLMERYMCSRFFIDFSDLGQQQKKLENYLANHFGLYDDDGDDDGGVDHDLDCSLDADNDPSEDDDYDVDDDVVAVDEDVDVDDADSRHRLQSPRTRPRCLTYDYLMTLYSVVDESTVCLMSHERRQTLGLIEELAIQVYFHEQHRLFQRHFERQQRQRTRTQATTTAPLTPTTTTSWVTTWQSGPPPLPLPQQRHQQQQQCAVAATQYGNSTVFYTPYFHHQHPAHHHQQQQQHRHHHHNNIHHHHHHHQLHHPQQHHYTTYTWMPCA